MHDTKYGFTTRALCALFSLVLVTGLLPVPSFAYAAEAAQAQAASSGTVSADGAEGAGGGAEGSESGDESSGDESAEVDGDVPASSDESGSGELTQLVAESDDASADTDTDTSRAALDVRAVASKGSNGISDGETYLISTAIASGYSLDIASASMKSGANAQLYKTNVTGAQLFIASVDESGYVTFVNEKSGMALDVKAAGKASGTNVQQYTSNDTYAQKWVVEKNEDGTWTISSAVSGLVLDVSGAKAANGTNVQVYESNGTAAQAWSFAAKSEVRSALDSRAAASKNANGLVDGDTYLINTALADKAVVDVASGSTKSGANVQLYGSNMTAAQRFKVSIDDTGYVTFINEKSGMALDVKAAGKASGTNVQQYTSNDTYAQKWVVEKNEDGTYSISSALWEGLSLDAASGKSANGTNVQIYSTNQTTAQKWNFIDADPDVQPCSRVESLEGKWFTLSTALGSGYVLDIASGSRSNAANVQLYSSNGTYAQLFQLVFVPASDDSSDGWYQVINAKSCCALDVAGGNLVNGTNVQQYAADESNANQLFSVTENSDGTYTFVSKASGLALSVAGGSAADKANVEGRSPDGTDSQKWSLTEVTDLLAEGTVTISSALSSSKVVDVASGSMSDGSNVQLYSSNSSLAQKWQVKKVADNTYTFQSIRSGLYLTADSDGNVCQRAADDTDAQKWVPSIQSGYTVLQNVSTGTVLDVSGAKTANGTNIQVYAANDTAAQRFDLSTTALISPGTYFVQAKASTSMVLDVSSGSTANKANVQMYKNNDTGAQKWVFSKNSDGTYTIKNAKSGKALDVDSADASDGANVQQYTANGTAAQKWKAVFNAETGGINFVSALDDNLYLSRSGLSNGSNVCLGSSSGDVATFTLNPTTYTASISGDATLDSYLNAIYAKKGKNLYTLFTYVASYSYRSGSKYPTGNWSVSFAKEMYERGSGNCYRFAALFCWLAKGLGYDANVVSGSVPSTSGGRAAHGWVEIHINGTTYICDPDMHNALPSYNWYMVTYSSAPMTYYK